MTVPATEPVPVKPVVAGSKSKPPPTVAFPLSMLELHSAPVTSSVVFDLVLALVITRLAKTGAHPLSGVASKLSTVIAPETGPLPNPPLAVPVSVTQVQAPLEPGQVEAYEVPLVQANATGAVTFPTIEAAMLLGLVSGFDAAASGGVAPRVAMRNTESINLDIEGIGGLGTEGWSVRLGRAASEVN